jgi:hypothetical protein
MQSIDLENMLKSMHEMYEEKRNPRGKSSTKRRRKR